MISKVNAPTHQMKVPHQRQAVLRTTPITTGKPGFTTRSGDKVIIEKFRTKRMNSETVGITEDSPEAYDIDDVEYAMRVTYSGEFLHAAPWSVGSRAYANVSHGCTGMSTENAAWLYDLQARRRRRVRQRLPQAGVGQRLDRLEHPLRRLAQRLAVAASAAAVGALPLGLSAARPSPGAGPGGSLLWPIPPRRVAVVAAAARRSTAPGSFTACGSDPPGPTRARRSGGGGPRRGGRRRCPARREELARATSVTVRPTQAITTRGG